MNCKPGDLAIVVTGQMSAGRIVRCIRILAHDELVADTNGVKCRVMGNDQWLIDGSVYRITLPDNCLRLLPAVGDKELRPIRPQPDDAVDEVIQRLGAPHKETA